ncbi:MAG: hypothetical protein ACKVHP_24620, partial [Verrucomicrobiales bacterium]
MKAMPEAAVDAVSSNESVNVRVPVPAGAIGPPKSFERRSGEDGGFTVNLPLTAALTAALAAIPLPTVEMTLS